MNASPDPATDYVLDPALESALSRLAQAQRILVALDFDGTLAPTVDDPDEARSLPAAREAASALAAEPGVFLALVSGRGIDSLRRVTDAPPEVLLAGSHGAEYLINGDHSGLRLTDTHTTSLKAIKELLDDVAAAAPGAWIETKAYGYALHTRLTEPHRARDAEATARSLGGVTLRHGKDVLEFSVVDATKRHALTHLQEITHADATLFAGDDVTDEDGFAALGTGDVGIKVGDGPTLASNRIPNLEYMPAVLRALLRLRRGR
ncbi:MAG TPA: trehalose-phosphatase [Terrimesophilobacter sp.]|nr:trehalose-phosphatase [Terrimesophilobacter sp.]